MRLGLDVGGTKVAGVLADSQGHIIDARTRVWRGHSSGPMSACRSILEEVRQFSRQRETAIESVGVSLAAWMNSDRSEVLVAANLPKLTCEKLRLLIRQILGVREVTFENDGYCAAVGEQIHTSTKSSVTAAIGLGTGVAGGLAHLTVPIRTGSPGAEFGHIPVTFGLDARACVCGGAGCLETKIGGLALAAEFPEATSTDARDREMAAYVSKWLKLVLMQVFASTGLTTFVFFGSVAERIWPLLKIDLACESWPLMAIAPKPLFMISKTQGYGPALGAAHLGGAYQ